MEYFILFENEDLKNLEFSSNLLGEVSFGIFWAGEGLNALLQISEKTPEKLTNVKIINAKGTEYTIEEFLDLLKSLQIRVN